MGGDGSFSNMQCACETCSCMKHYLANEEFFRKVFAVARHNAGKTLKACIKGGSTAQVKVKLNKRIFEEHLSKGRCFSYI